MKKALLIFLLFPFFFACKKKPVTLIKITAKTTLIDSTLAADEDHLKLIAPYKQKMTEKINTVISYTPKNLTRNDGDLESSLGNLMADACYRKANVVFKGKTGKNIDFAMFNYGGIRAPIPKGNVTNRHVFELMPFENSLVVVELSGEKVTELVTFFIDRQSAHPLSEQVNLTITNQGYQLTINGKPFQKDSNYFVLTSDYLQGGGSRMNFFKDPVSLHELDYKMRDAIIDAFKDLDTLKVNIDFRVKRK